MTHTATHSEHTDDKTIFGFWVYIMSDCVLFATLFATYAVLQGQTFGGPGIAELVSLPFVLWETLILLTSSFTIGLAVYFAARAEKARTLAALGATLVLGIAFLSMEVYEFAHLIAAGHGPWENAFLSSFFTLLGTHGLHVAFGALWLVVIMAHLVVRGLNGAVVRKIAILSLFWHFLDIIWIFIFTFVYLFGAIL